MYNAFQTIQREFNRRDKFMRLIVEQNVERVKECLDSGFIDVNQSHGVMRPLHLAVLTENFDIVTCLVEYGAQLNSLDAYNMAPLHYAARRNIDVVALLLLNHANPNVRDAHGKTPLHIAVRSRRPQVVELLLARGRVKVNAKDSYGETPLHKAVQNPDYFIIRNLLEYNADPNLKSDSGKIPLEDLVFRLQTDMDILVNPSQSAELERCLRLLLRVSTRYNASRECSVPIHLEAVLPDDIIDALQRNFPCSLKSESYNAICRSFPPGENLEECFRKLAMPETLRSYCLLEDL